MKGPADSCSNTAFLGAVASPIFKKDQDDMHECKAIRHKKVLAEQL